MLKDQLSFCKELSFPRTTPTDDAFVNGTRLEHVGVSGLDWNCCWAGCWLWMLRSPARNKEKRGSIGASPAATPMPKSVSF